MKVINYAANEITKFDEDYRKKLQGLDSSILWKVGRDLTFFTKIKDGIITSGEGEIDNPTIAIDIRDIREALKMLTGQVEFTDMAKKAKIAGDAQKVQQNLFILDTVKNYLGDLTGGGT
jgi:hypothetical protein